MIQFDFADIRQKARWTKARFDVKADAPNVTEGLNLGGYCTHKLDGQKCGMYNVLRIGMINKSERAQAVLKYKDIKKQARMVLKPEQEKKDMSFAEELAQKVNCRNCELQFKMDSFTDAIFFNCKYEVKFTMKKEDGRGTLKVARQGIIAHQSRVAIFDQNISKCRGLVGTIEPITQQEFRNQTLSSWLWENDF